jgi:hypothetical protein
MKLRIVVVVVCCLVSCRRALAHSTIFGSTGLIYNPTAAVMPPGQVSLHGSYLREEPSGQSQHGINLSGAMGIASRWEFSLGLVDAKIRGGGANFDTSGLGAGVKYLLREETETQPAVAIGVQHVNILKDSAAYVVFSKNLTSNQQADREVRGHLGVRLDTIDATRSVTGSDESQITFYGGVEAGLSQNVRFMGEVNTRHNGLAKSPITATLHFRLSENVTLFGGYTRLSPGSGWIAGVSYGFGKGRSR